MAIQNTSMSWRNLIAVLYLGLVAIQFTEVNRCYQCVAIKLEPPCYQGVNSSNGSNATNSKNCTTLVTKPSDTPSTIRSDTLSTKPSDSQPTNGPDTLSTKLSNTPPTNRTDTLSTKPSDSQPTNGTDTLSTKPSTIPSIKPRGESVKKGLKCYQCADTTLDTPCYHDYKGLIYTSTGENDTYVKDCTRSNPRWDRCVIETHIGPNGKYTLFRRDCHDGEYINTLFDDKEFHNLNANNFTTCAQVEKLLVCFTFCKTDFCNGPQHVLDCDDYNKRNMTADEIPDDLVCRGNAVYTKNFTTLVFMNLITLLVVWQLI